MILPKSARERAARPLREVVVPKFREVHTLPIGRDVWSRYVEALIDRIADLADFADTGPSQSASFSILGAWVENVVLAHRGVVSLLLALEPFEPFDDVARAEIVEASTEFTVLAAEALVGDLWDLDSTRLRTAGRAWPREGGISSHEVIRSAFKVNLPLTDESGEFRPALVFKEYAYKPQGLVETLAPHLASLGLGFSDRFTAVSVIGWICWAPDQVQAYASMDAFLNALDCATREVRDQALLHFAERSRITRQRRRELLRVVAQADRETRDEALALGISSAYGRLVEGPVRQFGWAMARLSASTWARPKTLARVREGMVARGGLLAAVAEEALLVDFRNGEAHEDLEWDAHAEVYRVDGNAIQMNAIKAAVIVALSFDRGCTAALTHFRARYVQQPIEILKGSDGPGPDWEAAEAYFGDNKLHVVRSDLDAKHGRIVLAELAQDNINPCFQALVCAHRLLPLTQRFSVYVGDSTEPTITVSRSALELGYPIWRRTYETLDRMPLYTFLPLNLAARLEFETPAIAARSAAWIAVDGVLDTLDGSPPVWDDEVLQLVLDCLELIDLALAQAVLLVPDEHRSDLLDVAEGARNLAGEILHLEPGAPDVDALEVTRALQALRRQHEDWGPVPRLPGIVYCNPAHLIGTEPRPVRRVSRSA